MNKKVGQAGFTLIELLIVIAIIGILSGVVLSALSKGRWKANDAKIKTQLNSLRSAAEIYFLNYPNSYGNGVGGTESAISPNFGNGCSTNIFTDPLLDPYTSTANYPSGTTMKCTANSGAYAVSASLSTNNPANADHWCVDSRGTSKAVADHIFSTNTFCP